MFGKLPVGWASDSGSDLLSDNPEDTLRVISNLYESLGFLTLCR